MGCEYRDIKDTTLIFVFLISISFHGRNGEQVSLLTPPPPEMNPGHQDNLYDSGFAGNNVQTQPGKPALVSVPQTFTGSGFPFSSTHICE